MELLEALRFRHQTRRTPRYPFLPGSSTRLGHVLARPFFMRAAAGFAGPANDISQLSTCWLPVIVQPALFARLASADDWFQLLWHRHEPVDHEAQDDDQYPGVCASCGATRATGTQARNTTGTRAIPSAYRRRTAA